MARFEMLAKAMVTMVTHDHGERKGVHETAILEVPVLREEKRSAYISIPFSRNSQDPLQLDWLKIGCIV